jgi:hypothetical protein
VDRNVFNGTPGDWRQVLPARAPKQPVRAPVETSARR